MKTQSLDLNSTVISQKNLISRLNQDGTVIIMKTDSADVFYKMNGLSAVIWNQFVSPTQPSLVLQALITRFANHKSQIETDFTALMNHLAEVGFLAVTTDRIAPTKATEIATAFAAASTYDFGKISEYNLAQIESEVLNESIYLDVFAGSDLRLKKDVESLKNPLEKVLALDGITYLWNEASAPQAPQNVQTGLVAQQVATVMPDLVKRDSVSGMLTINYTKITPYLVESIKELKSLIDTQNEKISQLENELKKLKH